jgi:hypothetical protein
VKASHTENDISILISGGGHCDHASNLDTGFAELNLKIYRKQDTIRESCYLDATPNEAELSESLPIAALSSHTSSTISVKNNYDAYWSDDNKK